MSTDFTHFEDGFWSIFLILQINDIKKCLTCIVSWLFKNLNEYVQKHVCMTIKIIPCFNLCQGIYTPFPPSPNLPTPISIKFLKIGEVWRHQKNSFIICLFDVFFIVLPRSDRTFLWSRTVSFTKQPIYK